MSIYEEEKITEEIGKKLCECKRFMFETREHGHHKFHLRDPQNEINLGLSIENKRLWIFCLDPIFTKWDAKITVDLKTPTYKIGNAIDKRLIPLLTPHLHNHYEEKKLKEYRKQVVAKANEEVLGLGINPYSGNEDGRPREFWSRKENGWYIKLKLYEPSNIGDKCRMTVEVNQSLVDFDKDKIAILMTKLREV